MGVNAVRRYAQRADGKQPPACRLAKAAFARLDRELGLVLCDAATPLVSADFDRHHESVRRIRGEAMLKYSVDEVVRVEEALKSGTS